MSGAFGSGKESSMGGLDVAIAALLLEMFSGEAIWVGALGLAMQCISAALPTAQFFLEVSLASYIFIILITHLFSTG